MDSSCPSKKTLSFDALLEMSCFSYFLILVYGFKIFLSSLFVDLCILFSYVQFAILLHNKCLIKCG